MRRLTLILIFYVVLGALYATFTPKWQAPDEPAHFNYIRTLAATGTLPVLQFGDYDHAYLEQIKAAKFPPTMPIDAIRYESYQPPLYYLAATPVWLAARAAGLDATVIALRLFSVALGALVLLVAFRIVRAIFPDDAWLALAIVGAMATVPQHLAVSASISNDLAAELVLVLILWLAVARVQSRLSHRQFALLGGVLFGAALLTKTTTYLPGALLLAASGLWQTENNGKHSAFHVSRITPHISRLTFHVSRPTPPAVRSTLYAFALAALIAAPMFVRGALTYGITDPLGIARHDAIVIGPPTTIQVLTQRGAARVLADFFAVSFKSFWAQFGWMGVLVSDRIYVALFLLCAVALLGFTFYVARLIRQRDLLTTMQRASLSLLTLLLVVAVADYIGYNFKFLQFQGRYLFPALISIAFILVIGLRELVTREYQRIVFVLLYGAMIVLDIVCLFFFIIPQLA